MGVVVSIIALLTAAAVPVCKGCLQHANRGDTKAALMKVAPFMEWVAPAKGMYPHQTLVAASVTALEGGRCNVTVNALDGASFAATATRVGGTQQAGDRCGDFRINHTGNRTILNASGSITADDC
jgi:type IV pilus assembly protein PilE